MGSKSFVEEVRMWQIRHGGRLKTMGPFWVSAKLGLKRVLPQINEWVEKAQEVTTILSRFETIAINPDPPHINFFHLYIQGDYEMFNNKSMELPKETGTFLFHRLDSTNVPGVAMMEMHCAENSMRFKIEELQPFEEKLLNT